MIKMPKLGIYNQDCLEFLKTIPSESVGLVLTDPPYFEIMKNDWDNQWKSEQEYLDWCKLWTLECIRILKPKRCSLCLGDYKDGYFSKVQIAGSEFVSRCVLPELDNLVL